MVSGIEVGSPVSRSATAQSYSTSTVFPRRLQLEKSSLFMTGTGEG